jgi:ABC-type transport system involved in multi-copper enzyme maturation permease subunit
MKALVMSELRQRVRGKRWWILLAVWFAILLGLVVLIRGAMVRSLEFNPDPNLDIGSIMFGSLALLVLGFACLIGPSLTATSINGERDRGTLAILQATTLRPWQIVTAKFAAALITTVAFLVATLPIALWSMLEGGVGLGKALAVYLTLFGITFVLLAAGLLASAVVRRPALSALLSYAFVFFLTIGTLILFGITTTTAEYDPETGTTDYGARWLILSPNPFVVLADAAPESDGDNFDDPLNSMRNAIRDIREPTPYFFDGGMVDCNPSGNECTTVPPPEPDEAAPVWPYGLGIQLAMALFALDVATERLRVPAKRLPRGERIA